VQRALAYPYDIPDGPQVVSVGSGAASRRRRHEPHVVLAVGSNAAPDRLRHKFRDFPRQSRIPLLDGTVRDHDVVFAARMTSYGAVPATLRASPGSQVSVKVTLLDDEQLAWLDATEAPGTGYERVEVLADAVRVDWTAEVPARPGPSTTYRAVAGPLLLDGAPVSLAAVAATGRRWPALTESELLDRLARDAGTTVAALVARVVEHPPIRRHLNQRLAGGARVEHALAEVANT
jgi:hypothetical protein